MRSREPWRGKSTVWQIFAQIAQNKPQSVQNPSELRTNEHLGPNTVVDRGEGIVERMGWRVM